MSRRCREMLANEYLIKRILRENALNIIIEVLKTKENRTIYSVQSQIKYNAFNNHYIPQKIIVGHWTRRLEKRTTLVHFKRELP